METKYGGRIIKVYPYGFGVQTDSGEIGTLKKEVIPDDKLSKLSQGDRVVVIDRGRRSVKGGILWDWNASPQIISREQVREILKLTVFKKKI